jgi:aromatic-L-amino-acid decarboxylase
MAPDEFRAAGHALVDWIAEYLASIEQGPVLAAVKPGDITAQLPAEAPELGEPLATVLADFERVLVPGLTRWNHPGFLAYFPVGFSGPGVLGDLLATAVSQQAMLWRTSPAATELEHVVLDWLRRAIGLTDGFEGVIYDTASTAVVHTLAAAREWKVPGVRQHGLAGRADVPRLRVYCSEHAHSSMDKAVVTLGLGFDSLRKIPADEAFRMKPDALEAAIREDVAAGIRPMAVVATVGTTSSTSIDPVPAIADICERHGLWLHVDMAYAGPAALLPEFHWMRAGLDRAHSVVLNPHKWLFTPFDLTACYFRDLETVREAFALTPEYLRTAETGTVKNLMDTGFQLGRRFRALKLWFVLRYFGLEGLRARIREHVRLARLFASWVDADASFVRVGDVPFSLVCFRAVPTSWAPRHAPASDETSNTRQQIEAARGAELDALNERVMEIVNRSGETFISHTKLDGRIVLRVAIGNLRTTEAHVARAWALLTSALAEATSDGQSGRS